MTQLTIRPMRRKLIILGLLMLMGLLLVLSTMSRQRAALANAAGVEPGAYLPLIMQPRPFAEEVASGFSPAGVSHITHAGDERLFIVERDGRVKILHPDQTVTTFLDIADRVIYDGEQGLFTLVFDPDYASNGYFYVAYTGLRPGWENYWFYVSRFQVTANPDVADPASENRFFMVQMVSVLHNGGGMAFSPMDGWLYVGVGDDQQLMVAQESSDKGKIVRLDVSAIGGGVNGQPGIETVTAVSADRIAKGLRNPWRFDFDAVTGDLYIGEVGDNSWEEVNMIPNGYTGSNYGWPCMEGPDVILVGDPRCMAPHAYTPSLHFYPHHPACAIIGGHVFRPDGPQSPPYFVFGDACTREVFTIHPQGGQWVVDSVGQITELAQLNSFGLDHEGNLYASGFPGTLYRLSFAFP